MSALHTAVPKAHADESSSAQSSAQSSSAQSSEYHRLDLGSLETWNWLTSALHEALERGKVDGHAEYLSSNLIRHVAVSTQAVTKAMEVGEPRLVAARRRLLVRWRAIEEIAHRINGAVSHTIALGTSLGQLERALLCRMLDAIDAEVARIHEHDVELFMSQHWDDVGGSG